MAQSVKSTALGLCRAGHVTGSSSVPRNIFSSPLLPQAFLPIETSRIRKITSKNNIGHSDFWSDYTTVTHTSGSKSSKMLDLIVL